VGLYDISLLNGKECSELLSQFVDQNGDNGSALFGILSRYISYCSHSFPRIGFHERQDILQEVAVKILCHADELRKSCSLPLLYTMVRNQCIDHMRKHKTQLNVYQHSAEPEENRALPPPGTDPSSQVAMLDNIDCLDKVFDHIESQPTGKMDLLIYTQFALGLSYAEISVMVDRTVSAVGRRISILRDRLKQLREELC
jgi:DNA-directed RNA polymerase specialized sigma24 family protein